MHHIYPMAKGDPLCPLGFHPQVRWPTRCKRCFRDYKEHCARVKDDSGSIRRDDTTVSSPNLSSWTSRGRESSVERRASSSSSSSKTDDSSNSSSSGYSSSSRFGPSRPAASWTSTPDLGNLNDDTSAEVTVSLTLPRKRLQPLPEISTKIKEIENKEKDISAYSTEYTFRRRSLTPKVTETLTTPTSSTSRTTTTAKTSTAINTSTSPQTTTTSTINRRRATSPEKKTPVKDPKKPKDINTASTTTAASNKIRSTRMQSLKEVRSDQPSSPEVDFMLQVKQSKKNNKSKSSSSGDSSSCEDDDLSSLAGTETTETTLIDRNDHELLEQIESLKAELEIVKTRCEKAEREKSDILLRRIAALDTTSSKTAASEVLKLQQKVNELHSTTEDMKDEKRSLSLRVKELEDELESRPDKVATQKTIEELRSKLSAAEQLCEELMDENEDMKKEMRELEEEIEEMQDNFREDQADEYVSLKKELEQTNKNCRVLSFKLRKAERRAEQLETEKAQLEREAKNHQTGASSVERIKSLEKELSLANEVGKRLQKDLEDVTAKLKARDEALQQASKEQGPASKKKPPMLSAIGRTSSGEKISRESMRGGSQEDPQQLLRDLQDSLEREADMREQLKYAEEEAETMRRKASRVEEDNESLVLQLKKMAIKARSRKKSPSPARLTPEPAVEKDEGISDIEDPAELKIQLELNEQETAVLRRKVEDLERERDAAKRKNKELQDKLSAKTPVARRSLSPSMTSTSNQDSLQDQKIKVLEEDLSELRKKLIEKDRDCERLHAELAVTQKRSKASIQKSKSLDGGNEQQALDLKRQLTLMESEASVLRSRAQQLESENDKILAENKKLQLSRGIVKSSPADKEKITSLQEQLTEANNKINELNNKLNQSEKGDTKNSNAVTKEPADIVKLKKDFKTKTEEFDKMKTTFTKLETENVKLLETLKRIRDESVITAIDFYKKRTPKRPTDMTTKLQLKRMVEDLEVEMSDVLSVLKKSQDSNIKKVKEDDKEVKNSNTEILEKELNETKKKLAIIVKELEDEKKKNESEGKQTLEAKKKATEEKEKYDKEKKQWEENLKKQEDLKKKLEQEKLKTQEEKDKLSKEKQKLEEDLKKITAEKSAATLKRDELLGASDRLEALKKDLEEERRQTTGFKKQLEIATKNESEKEKNRQEQTKRLTETEDKLKRIEKQLALNKTKLTKAEKELSEEKDKNKRTEVSHQELSSGWLKDRDSLKKRITELEATVAAKETSIGKLELSLNEEKNRTSEAVSKAADVSSSVAAGSKEVGTLKEELTSLKTKYEELKEELEKSEKTRKNKEIEHRKLENVLRKENDSLERKLSDVDMDLEAERKRLERIKSNHEKELISKEHELTHLKTKLKSSEGTSSSKKVQEELQNKIEKLESDLTTERQEYEDLTTKYEMLEEEHVVTKAQLVMEKENLTEKYLTTSRELKGIETELKTLRDTYNNKQDSWIKEKLDLQERLKELEEKSARSFSDSDAWTIERSRLKNIIEDKGAEADQYRRDKESFSDQMDLMRRENEELRKKLEDFDKVDKIQRNISADTTAVEKELRETKTKLAVDEKAKKSEIAALKLRYDGRVALISEELHSLQVQLSRFKKERDTYRHLTEAAQRTIADLKAQFGINKRDSGTTSADETEETRTKIATLEQQVSCMEDELSEARLQSSKLKTELVSERSAWEVKKSEMQSHINELEEDRIVASGRTKIPGMRTRMELAWHKEREEQHRLLQETSTLARDLRQTLFEVERERDKERLEAKRRQEQLRKQTEDEQDETKRKINELQCDLLELRDAHAKLRTTNEKLRRERERYEKDREEMRQVAQGRRRADIDEDKKINAILNQIDELMRLAPDLFPQRNKPPPDPSTPTPPRRMKGPKSRESSPGLERKEFVKESSVDRKIQLQTTVQRLTEATEELRKYQRLSEEERDRERSKRSGLRRAASTESDTTEMQNVKTKAKTRGINKEGSLYRKSLSLEQTNKKPDRGIWKDEETDGSLNSLQSTGSEMDNRFYSLQRRQESPMDSRLSGGSTTSEVPVEKKKKKGLLGKLKKLTKSRSIDETHGGEYQGYDSDASYAEDKGSKKDIRDKITGLFKKSGSRSGSVERNKKEPSPALPERRESTLPRPSPAPSETNQSSTSRPLVANSRRSMTPTSSKTRSK